jgi:hypothetical protein
MFSELNPGKSQINEPSKDEAMKALSKLFLAFAVVLFLLQSVHAQQVCIERRWQYGVKEWVRREASEAGEKNAWRLKRDDGRLRYERSCPPSHSAE